MSLAINSIDAPAYGAHAPDQDTAHENGIIARALEIGAAAVILSHNHPSGSTEPSRADEALTRQLKTVLELVDVRVLDHIIVSGGDSLSMAERGLM